MRQSFVCVLLYALFSFNLTHLYANSPETKGLTIHGSIAYSSQNEIEIALFSDPLMYREEHYLMLLDATDRFQCTIDLNNGAALGELRYQGQAIPLWLEPGQDLYIQIDGSNFPASLTYSNQNANSQFLADFYNAFRSHPQEIEAKMAVSSADAYKLFVEELYKTRQRFIGNSAHFGNLSSELKEHIRIGEQYWLASQLLRYAFDRPLFDGGTEPLVLSESYYLFLKNVDINQNDALHIQEYRCFVERYAEFIEFSSKLNSTARSFTPEPLSGEALCYIQASELATKCRKGNADPSDLEATINCFISQCGSNGLSDALLAIYDETRAATVGSMAPDFTLSNLQGKKVALSDFRGKTVYLEFWATWCGPCRKEMPKLKELEEQYNGDLVVLFVSLDEDRSTWSNYLTGSGETAPNHLYAAGNMSKAEIAKQYGVRTLPSVFVISPCGELVYINKQGPQCETVRSLLDSVISQYNATKVIID